MSLTYIKYSCWKFLFLEQQYWLQLHYTSLSFKVSGNNWNQSPNIKTENIDQKPHIPQHPHKFLVNSPSSTIPRSSPSSQQRFISPSSRGRGRGGGGRGRDNGVSPAKRKLGMPPITSPKQLKQEQLVRYIILICFLDKFRGVIDISQATTMSLKCNLSNSFHSSCRLTSYPWYWYP